MKHLLPLLILILTFTISSYAQNSCAVTLSTTNQTINWVFGHPAAAITFNVQAAAGCAWVATSNVDWITITNGASGVGNGAVTFTYQTNYGDPRTGTISINNQIFTANQPSACSYRLETEGNSVSGDGGTYTFRINTNQVFINFTCSTTATSTVNWISASGGGSIVSYTVQPNTTGKLRVGQIIVRVPGVGQELIFTVYQQAATACAYVLSSTSFNSSSSAETGTVSVTTQSGCSWSALSNVLWITTFTNSNGTVTFSVQANTGPARTGTITIAGQILPSLKRMDAHIPLTVTMCFIRMRAAILGLM